MIRQDGVDILADHSLLLAIPAFLPAIALVGLVLFIAMRDRHAEKRENADTEPPSAQTEENP
ncbi:hypothetical protein [Nocardia rhizosphaerihabitans]|uniref:Uncharacterized protein n=1 Tax=Nocardia rhizosphaerihabitans TaxID=1691570 RepID=A0ABQ2KT59_9NOCA|nr:hypothetical protein [Nocardia rhizosphaerihabitans]GGN92352.1 hypothetical protein GCM10011610_53340 [Nocardia rhizosphaerihabitans]